MRIGIGLNLLTPDNGGVTNYALTLLRHWPEFAPEHPMILFSFAHNESLLATLPAASRRHEIRVQTQEDVLAHFDRIDVYFCPFGTLWPRPVRKPSVLTFHDMQERFFPQFFTPAQLEERFYHYDGSLRMADAVIAVSEFTKQSCVEIGGVSAGKIHRVHHAPDELPADRVPEEWNPAGWDKFVFYPANFWEHKNHLNLLRALAQLRTGGLTVRCVMTGSLLGRDARWQSMIAETNTGDLVRHLGRRSRAELAWLFRSARALVFPSQFEGFGIPVIEAMQAGCPVVCSGTTGLPETAGNEALYFDPAEVNAIARAIEQIWTNDSLCASLSERGRHRSAGFTAEQLVRRHVDAFALARRRYHPWKHWYRTHFLQPRLETRRSELLPRETRAAQRLLRRASVV